MPVCSSSTTLPTPRRASCHAMLAPEHPPPITTTSATSATQRQPAVTGERRCVLTNVPTQLLVLLRGWLLEKPAAADRWHASSGQVSPHLGELEAGQHPVDDWRTGCLHGTSAAVGQDGSGQGTARDERLRSVLLDAATRCFNDSIYHRLWWRPIRIQIVGVDIK